MSETTKTSEVHYSRQGRSERLIAMGRVILAVVIPAALWLDPARPDKYGYFSYALVAGYLGYSLVLLGLPGASVVRGKGLE